MVSVEQSTNMGGGRVWPLSTVRDVLEAAHGAGLRTHMDGARLMNAAVASGVHASAFAGGFDTAWLDFSKGLGAPVGAVLVGSEELIDEAWRYKQMLGGALRQSGVADGRLPVCAGQQRRAAGRRPRPRPAAGRRAGHGRRGGAGPARRWRPTSWCSRWPARPSSASAPPPQDVHVGAVGPSRVRAVLHLDVDDADVDRALEVLADVA